MQLGTAFFLICLMCLFPKATKWALITGLVAVATGSFALMVWKGILS